VRDLNFFQLNREIWKNQKAGHAVRSTGYRKLLKSI